jgi:hypothetical protein
MHGNLAQIGRALIASSLVQSHIDPDPINYFLSQQIAPTSNEFSAPSTPFSLILWQDPSVSRGTANRHPAPQTKGLKPAATHPIQVKPQKKRPQSASRAHPTIIEQRPEVITQKPV